VKIEGDGCPVSAHTNFCIMSAVLLDEATEIYRAAGRHLLGVASGKEGYATWRVCFGKLLAAINNLERDKFVKLTTGETVEVELYLGKAMMSNCNIRPYTCQEATTSGSCACLA
jgi:hypothetical protein